MTCPFGLVGRSDPRRATLGPPSGRGNRGRPEPASGRTLMCGRRAERRVDPIPSEDTMIRRTTVGLVGAALALATACGDAGSDRAGGTLPQPARTVTMANFGGDSGDLDQFIQEVRRRSHGSLRIDVRNFWRRGDPAAEKAVIGDVRAGRADIAAVGSRAWDAAGVPTLRALAAPLLIDSYAYEERVLRDPVVAHMLDGVRRAGLAPLGVLPGALRRPLGATGPLLGPADYRGRRIGLTASPVGAATLRALGATPVPYAVATSIDGLDGAEAQIVAISGNRYDRHAKYLTANVALWPRPLVVFAGRRVWDSLTGDQRAALTGASAAVLEPDLARVRAEEHDDGQTLCRRHVRFLTATRADTTALRRAVQPVYTALERDPDTR